MLFFNLSLATESQDQFVSMWEEQQWAFQALPQDYLHPSAYVIGWEPQNTPYSPSPHH